jgi:hypothetical protein
MRFDREVFGLEDRLPSLYGTSSVTTLAFRNSSINPRALGHLVRISRTLESFEYSYGGGPKRSRIARALPSPKSGT